jgi:protein gp37
MKDMKRNPVLLAKYSGPPRLAENELAMDLGEGKTIFVCNCTDLFADDVPREAIEHILSHTLLYPKNTYLIQTKNPERAMEYMHSMPSNYILGTTVECDDYPSNDISKAPSPMQRVIALKEYPHKKMINIEPVMKCWFPQHLLDMIDLAEPDFVSIGADSGDNHLVEPDINELKFIMDSIRVKRPLKIKKNLARLTKGLI